MVTHGSAQLLREVPPGSTAHFVIDASVALKWLWDEADSEEARRYAHGAVHEAMRLSVPSLFWYEIANALRYASHHEPEYQPRSRPWQLMHKIPISTVDFNPEGFPHLSQLAAAQGITVYDASYVFLAQSLQVPLITADVKLVESCANLPYVWLLGAV